MKSTIGMLAVLLFVATLAVGQNALPFPQAANPALQDSDYYQQTAPTVVYQSQPSSMAANAGATVEIAPLPAYRERIIAEFPMAANPFLGVPNDTGKFVRDRSDTGTPFPQAANPAIQ